MKKFKKEVIENIEELLNSPKNVYRGNKGALASVHYRKKTGELKPWGHYETKYKNLRTLSIEDMFSILCGDYEVELSVSDEIKKTIEATQKTLKDLEFKWQTQETVEARCKNLGFSEGLNYCLKLLENKNNKEVE